MEFSGAAFRQCPRALLLDEPWIAEAWNDSMLLERYGVPPAGGGMDDQPNRTAQALIIIAGELERIDAERQARREN